MLSESGDLRSRFWSKVKVGGEDECWVWIPDTKRTDFRPGGRGTMAMAAHRFAYELEVGPVPKGVHLNHTCGNKRCCNPDHIKGPHTTYGRDGRTKVLIGERKEIRAEYAAGVTIPELRKAHQVSVPTLLCILYEKPDR